ncbi:regulator of G protein signaling superfamily [Aureobasidium pullulans]|nr:regulator of G protein signaling superfamily [Aureobasidium pullulans]
MKMLIFFRPPTLTHSIASVQFTRHRNRKPLSSARKKSQTTSKRATRQIIIATMAHRTPTPDITIQRNRLPNLYEVLSRQTKPPVDLFSFYIYMRDAQRSVDYLDFWLDVSQHMSLCRHYVRGLHRSVLAETPELEKSGSKRSSQVLEQYDDSGMVGPSSNDKDTRVSAFLRGDNNSMHSPSQSLGSNNFDPQNNRRSMVDSTQDTSPYTQDQSPTGTTVSRQDIRASAEKILYTYLLQGSEREIIIPVGILEQVTDAIETQQRDDPEVFDAAKDYVFQAMERDAFPGFLRAKALGNIVQPSMMLRLVVGLVALFAAIWTAFVLIFLDMSRSTRCWAQVILPFTIAIYFLVSHQYMLDPIQALLGYSEYTFTNYFAVKENFVHRLLTRRSMMCLMWIAVIDAAVCCLFIFVPGKRL